MKSGGSYQRAKRPVVGAAGSGGPPLLYVDAPNFFSTFFDGDILEKLAPGVRRRAGRSGDMWKDICCCKKNVRVFMHEAKAAGWKVTVFMDMVKDRKDEIDKWWNSKRSSMQSGGSSMCAFALVLCGHFFESEGAVVRYAAATDNDPTLAAYASLDDAAVLSADGDFLRYHGTRPTGEHYFLKRLYSGFSVGDERNCGKLALWQKTYPTQLRDRKDWELITGVGESKGGLEKFLDFKPLTSPTFIFVPPRAQRDALSRPCIRIGVPSSVPFAYPGNHTSLERLLRPLRLAIYQELKEHRVCESSLQWVEYSDGWLPEVKVLHWKFWGARWELEKDPLAEESANATSVPDSWDHDEEQEEDATTCFAGENLLAEEDSLIKTLASKLHDMSEDLRPDKNNLYNDVADMYRLIFGPVNFDPEASDASAGRIRVHRVEFTKHCDLAQATNITAASPLSSQRSRGSASGHEHPPTSPLSHNNPGEGGISQRALLPHFIYDVGNVGTTESEFRMLQDETCGSDEEEGVEEKEGLDTSRSKESQGGVEQEGGVAGRRKSNEASSDQAHPRNEITVTFLHCRNEVICRFMSVMVLLGACLTTKGNRGAFVYSNCFWLLEEFLRTNGLI